MTVQRYPAAKAVAALATSAGAQMLGDGCGTDIGYQEPETRFAGTGHLDDAVVITVEEEGPEGTDIEVREFSHVL